MQRKISTKKKNEKNLSQLVKLINANDGIAPSDDANSKSPQEIYDNQLKKQKLQVEERITEMKAMVQK